MTAMLRSSRGWEEASTSAAPIIIIIATLDRAPAAQLWRALQERRARPKIDALPGMADLILEIRRYSATLTDPLVIIFEPCENDLQAPIDDTADRTLGELAQLLAGLARSKCQARILAILFREQVEEFLDEYQRHGGPALPVGPSPFSATRRRLFEEQSGDRRTDAPWLQILVRDGGPKRRRDREVSVTPPATISQWRWLLLAVGCTTSIALWRFEGSRRPSAAIQERVRACDRDAARCGEIISFYEEQCRARSGVACWNLGLLYQRGRGIPTDEPRALTYFKRACDLGEDLGCKLQATLPQE